MKSLNTGYKGKFKVFDGGLGEDEKTPVYVGIDQSLTHYGITVLAKDGRYISYVYMSPLRGVDRLSDIGLFLGEKVFEIYNIQDAAMEGYAYSSSMAHMAGEIGGFTKLELKHWCYATEGKYPLIVAPAMLKKYIAGKGQGVTKNQILLNVYKKWGLEFTDDNAADSYGLARIAAGMATLAYEKEIIKKLLDPKYREKP
jgi:Holliday junction resolvasome RuvABC endonuclease subunit